MKAELDGTRLHTALRFSQEPAENTAATFACLQEANSLSRLVTRVRPRPIRCRYRTGPRVPDDGALWLQTERAPRRPVKGQRSQR